MLSDATFDQVGGDGLFSLVEHFRYRPCLSSLIGSSVVGTGSTVRNRRLLIGLICLICSSSSTIRRRRMKRTHI